MRLIGADQSVLIRRISSIRVLFGHSGLKIMALWELPENCTAFCGCQVQMHNPPRILK